jgi:hypothetical protein
MKTIDEEIKKKEAEIEHYEGVLIRNRHSRWYNQGCRHMEELKADLTALLAERDKQK